MQRINLTLVVNLQVEEADMDRVMRDLMDAPLTQISRVLRDPEQPNPDRGIVQSVSLLEGLHINVVMQGAGEDGGSPGSDRRYVASPHGLIPAPSEAELDLADHEFSVRQGGRS